MDEFDYVVVGAGSAGCAIAARLSEDGRHSVCLLEYGGSDWSMFVQMPSALAIPMNSDKYNWGYWSEPEPHLGGRRLKTPRGKVLGGSSSINGMVYVRGHAGDYDTWEDMGAAGWGYRHVLPYFQRMETSHGGQDGWRGTDGPLHITRGSMANPLYASFVEAGREAGYQGTADYNGQQQEGFGPMEMTVWRGRRWSAANAYLKPARQRPNLEIRTGAFTTRILTEGKRAAGVEYDKGDKRTRVRARREVIVSAGSINSPKLLLLSGIGDDAQLAEHGIEPVHHLPGVGRNLQDHLEFYFQQECTQRIGLYSKLNLISKGLIGARWLLTKTGLGATNHFESCAFVRSKAGIRYPDIQYHFFPVAVSYDGKSMHVGEGFQAHAGPMRSKSRGAVTLKSADPFVHPAVLFNYMSHEDDWTEMRTCVRLTREIFAQDAFAPYRGKEIAPGADVTSDADIDAFITRVAESAYHPCGTCKMGAADDPAAVVDPECRVIGMEALRVADSSIFPQITNGNLNGPSIMTGEKAADHILGRAPLPASNLEPWVHPDWETAQR